MPVVYCHCARVIELACHSRRLVLVGLDVPYHGLRYTNKIVVKCKTKSPKMSFVIVFFHVSALGRVN